MHTFPGGVALISLSDQTVTATDTASGITGSITITVGPRPVLGQALGRPVS